jgi:polyisoprenoid-binding protein YceI
MVGMRCAALLLMLALGITANAQARAIDTARSKLTIFADSGGLFSFAGHDHTVAAPLESGSVQASGNQSVTLRVNAREMKVLDPDLEPKKRAEVQRDMHAKVLESERFEVIEFRSTKAEPRGDNSWTVTGDLMLHGVSKPVVVNVRRSGELYTGSAKFKQTAFGIKPISVAGGTVKVKDELKIEFEIYLK